MPKRESTGPYARAGGRKRSDAKPPRRKPSHLAQCGHGLEEVLESELRALGARDVQRVRGGVLFEADRRLSYKATLWLRSAMRVLEPVIGGDAASFDELYELTKKAPWEALIGADCSFAINASISNSSLTAGQFAVMRVKDAIVDRIRERRGRRPSVDKGWPDVPVKVVIRGTETTVYRDLAGDSLHRRGDQPIQVKSPLPESVAAGLLMLTEWDRESPLLDPMCGGGTFLLEAARLASKRAPGLGRDFAAERFPDAKSKVWHELREEALAEIDHEAKPLLMGSDRHSGAIGIARDAAQRAGFEEMIQFKVADVAGYTPATIPSVVVTNPPWGLRLGAGEDLENSWRGLGTFLRRCSGATAYVLSGSPEVTRHLGLKTSRRHPVRVARHDLRWLRYEMR